MSSKVENFKKVLKRCQKSCMFFIENFCKVKHPAAGIIPFTLFPYQKRSILDYLRYRYNIYRKCRQCFVTGSMIWTQNGPKPIETIKKGDKVYSFINNERIIAEVGQVNNNGESNQLVEVQTYDGHKSVCKFDHRFLTVDGWTRACDLNGQSILRLRDDGWYNDKIKSIKELDTIENVYDLTIPGSHNYIVDGAVVHNCGISTLTGAFALWYAMFFSQKTILIVSKRDKDAIGFLSKNVKFVYDHLPEEFRNIYGNPPETYNEHQVVFPNGSSITSLTSSKDTLRSNSASLNILDEVAFMPHMSEMWSGGQQCCTLCSAISTSAGIRTVGNILADQGNDPKTSAPHNITVITDNGQKHSNAVYNNGYAPTVRITTKLGYVFEATHNHRLRIIDKDGNYVWNYMKDMRKNDQVCLLRDTCVGEPVKFVEPELATVCVEHKNSTLVDVQCNKCYKTYTRKVRSLKRSGYSTGDYYVCPSCVNIDDEQFIEPDAMDDSLAELLGYYIGDGTLYKTRPKRIVLNCDPSYGDLPNKLISRFAKFGIFAYSEKGNGTVDVRANNAKFVNWLVRHGLDSKSCAEDARIPDKILSSGPKILAAFLRGLFEADGYSTRSQFERVGFSTRSDVLADQVRTSLLSLGIVTKTVRRKGTGYSNKMKNEVYILDQVNRSVFREKVGFISDRKSQILDEYKSDNSTLRIVGKAAQHLAGKLHENEELKHYERARCWEYQRRASFPLHRLREYKNLLNEQIVQNDNLLVDSIVKVEYDHALTADISVPDNNTYIANGFVSHNTLVHGGCLSPDSLILCEDGLRQIGDFHKDDSVNWEDTSGGAYLEDGDISNITKSYYNGRVKTRKIMTRDGHYIEASLDHKLRVLDNNGYSWKQVKDLSINDHLVLSDRFNNAGEDVSFNTDIFNQFDVGCRLCGCEYDRALLFKISKEDDGYCASCLTTIRMIGNKNIPSTLTEDMSELIGIIIGDGFYNIKGTFGISCDRKCDDFIEYIHNLIKKLGFSPRDEISNKDYSVRFNSRVLFLLFKKNNIIKESSLTARIPHVILRSIPKIRCAFLRGLFETDGSISGNYVSLSSSSVVLIRQTQTMLLNLGIRSRIYEATRKGGFSDNPQYVLHLKTRRDIIRFRSIIGFLSNEKQTKLENIKETDRIHNDRFTNKEMIYQYYNASKGLLPEIRKELYQKYWRGAISREKVRNFCEKYPQLRESTIGYLVQNDLFTDQIESIDESTSETYDITVEDKHYYIANGFISHNSIIAISTSNGVGNWYHSTWTDAIANRNEFHPIRINWWDMDWSIKYRDAFTKKVRQISPTQDIRKCETKEEKNKWGPYYSPWLEEQYRALQERGEAHLFRQEVLAEFIGVGNTVLSREQLLHVGESVRDKYWTVGIVDNYTHPVTGQNVSLDFENQLYVWKRPVKPEPDKIENGRIVKMGSPGHTYAIGVDIASGEDNDYDAVQVVDCVTHEQVAELVIRVPPSVLLMMMDYLGKWYNGAFIVPERTGLGIPVCHDLYHTMGYVNTYRMKNPAGQMTKKVGFPTSPTHKPTIVKALVDHIGEDGVIIYGKRTLEQLNIFVHLGNKKVGNVDGPGNHDDLTISLGLAFIGMAEALQMDQSSMIPATSRTINKQTDPIMARSNKEQIEHTQNIRGMNALIPVTSSSENKAPLTANDHISQFMRQLGGLPSNTQLNPIFQRNQPKLDLKQIRR